MIETHRRREGKYLRLVKKFNKEDYRWLKNKENLGSNELAMGWRETEMQCFEARITRFTVKMKKKSVSSLNTVEVLQLMNICFETLRDFSTNEYNTMVSCK